MSIHFIKLLDNISSLTLDNVGIITCSSCAKVFKIFDTWSTNNINSEIINFDHEIKEFHFYRNKSIELFSNSLRVDSREIILEKPIRSIKYFKDYISAISGANIVLYSIDLDLLAILSGHRGRIRDYTFSKDLLISVSEDRTLKIWNLNSYACDYTSSILSKSVLSCVDIDQDEIRLVVADEDCICIFFEIINRKRIHQLKKIDVGGIFNSSALQVCI